MPSLLHSNQMNCIVGYSSALSSQPVIQVIKSQEEWQKLQKTFDQSAT